VGRTYPSSLSLKKTRHVRSANVSYFFEGVSQLGGANMPPRDISCHFEGVGAWFPIKFPNCPIKFLLFPSLYHQNPFVLIKFPKNSHQIPLVPINNPSKSFYSHQVPRKFYQIPFVPIIILCSHQVLLLALLPSCARPTKCLPFRSWVLTSWSKNLDKITPVSMKISAVEFESYCMSL
jgi:hypothetical protein